MLQTILVGAVLVELVVIFEYLASTALLNWAVFLFLTRPSRQRQRVEGFKKAG